MLTLRFVLSDVLSAALDSGVAISAILIFFILQYPDNGHIGLNTIQTWWGNTVSVKTADYGPGGGGTPLLTMPPGVPFGYVATLEARVIWGPAFADCV